MSVQADAAPAAGAAAGDLEKRAYGKVFWRIVPFLMLCYVVAYLDRVNVGFAKLQMSQDLGFSETVFGFGAGVFFFGYFLFEVPSNIMLHKIGARVWIARIMVSWGIISAAFLLVPNATTFYVLRFLLGIAEAGFYPGIILYLTYWYPSHRRARIIAVFMAAIPISGIFGNPLSGWIMDAFHETHGLAGWQWMFLIEAIPALLLGVAVFFYLDNGIREAKWLAEDEKALLEAEIARDNRTKETPRSVGGVFKDGRVWLMCLIYFSFVTGQYALTFWMPTLIKATGVTGNLNIGLISAIPFLCAAVTMVLVGRSADHRRERRWHLIIPATCGAIGFIVAATSTSTPLAILSLSIAAAGVITCAPLFWSLPTAFLTGTAAAAGIALINSVGNLAGFVSPYLIGFLKDLTGSNQIGMYALAGFLLVGVVAVLSTPARLVNR
ncbi:MFS transporter [Ancylobacter lacus]|uniref:MFS transporter n=1 Tax=Ancylobacter lacus TaxID=2579970 RepID=UPI001BCD445F|nr:MFS transporter [Ancylobacter lacus]MBS7537374.1 MFS transporter [Ancylobacter lacus]